MIMVTPLSSEQQPLTLSVEGMTCAACAARIERVLEKEDSIKNAVVNFPLKKAIVEFNESIDTDKIIEKIKSTNNDNILITERGTSFGYNNLVSDFRSLEIMKKFNYPIIYDATHSVQEPGGLGKSSGGKREFVPILAKAAVAVGVGGIFIETHDDPDKALSDGPNMLNIKDLEFLIEKLIKLDQISKLGEQIKQ